MPDLTAGSERHSSVRNYPSCIFRRFWITMKFATLNDFSVAEGKYRESALNYDSVQAKKFFGK
jgi:hypothetical protein